MRPDRAIVAIGWLALPCAALAATNAATGNLPPPHPGEPAAHATPLPDAAGTPARLYARQHLEGPPRIEPVYARVSPPDHWELTLPKFHPAGADAILTLAVRDGAVANGYTLAPTADNLFHYTSTYRTELKGDRLTGSVRVRFLSKNQLNASEFLGMGEERIAIFDVQAAGGKLSGKAQLIGGGVRRETAVAGTIHAGGRPPRPEDTLAGGELWPGHRGPYGSGGAVVMGHAVLNDMNQARPVWKAPEDLPDGRAHSSGGGNTGPIVGDRSCVDWLRHSGAKSGPAVADGRVFVYTMIPSGAMRDETGMPSRYSLNEFDRAVTSQAAHDWLPGGAAPKAVQIKSPQPGEAAEESDPLSAATDDASAARGARAESEGAAAPKPRAYPQRSMFCIGADDTIFCFDARTGATLWKTVYPGASANYGGSKGGPHLTPFVWRGKVYVLGSTERIYCLDAQTGKEVWQAHTGWSATAKHKVLQDCLAAKKSFPVNRSLETALTVADGVVVCSDNRGKLYQSDGYPYTEGPGLIGLDAATGKRLWQTPEAVANGVTPCRWLHKGRTYILTDGGGHVRTQDPETGKHVNVATAGGRKLRALDPKTGNFLWEVPCGPTGMCLVSDEDHAIANAGGEGGDGQVTCFRVTPERAEKLWSLDRKYQMPWGGYFYPVIHRGHLYFASGGESTVVCVRLADGKVLAEASDMGGGHTGGGHFLVAAEDRTLCSGICVTGTEANTQPLHAPWRAAFAIGYLTPMDPAIADGRLFLRDKTGLVCYDLRATP
jgi:outer membrane protein assembly factor BamB